MNGVVSFESLKPGMALPAQTRTIDREQLIRFAGAVDDYSAPHWDHLYMVANGFPGVIVHGWLTFAVMCQVVNRWIPLEQAELTHYSVRYLKPSLPGPAVYGGRVTAVSAAAGPREAQLEIWADTTEGLRMAVGQVTVRFP